MKIKDPSTDSCGAPSVMRNFLENFILVFQDLHGRESRNHFFGRPLNPEWSSLWKRVVGFTMWNAFGRLTKISHANIFWLDADLTFFSNVS